MAQPLGSVMQVMRGTHNVDESMGGGVLTIGNFDGVHVGHRRIIEAIRKRAFELGAPSALLTFDPPPARVLGRKHITPQITTLSDKIWLLEDAGLDVMVVQTFDLDFAALSPETFMEAILESGFSPQELWVGYDFLFGKARRGDTGLLKSFFEPKGRLVSQMDAICDQQGVVISSTRVRKRIGIGDVSGAAELLGRPHFLRGKVIHGEQRGRTIQFPTANLEPLTELLPQHGVYATWVSLGGKVFPSVTNVGERPTLGGGRLRVESHLFDFDQDIYGEEITVWFESRLRGEIEFSSFEALRQQIVRDCAVGRTRLMANTPHKLVAESTAPGSTE